MVTELLAASPFKGREQSFKSVGNWACSAPIILDGREFSFKNHEYLRVPYEDAHPFQVEMKAAQLGLTSKAILRSAYGARYRGFRGILYLFPSRADVQDFAKGRVDPLVDDNPDTVGRWIKDTDSSAIKRIHNCYIYFRGMKSRVGLKSLPIDFLVIDEQDEAPQNSVDMAMERMSHSEFREVLKLSNPTIPDYGVHKAFLETDQRYWHLKCPSCGSWTCLEESFPGCLLEIDGRVIRVCDKCQAELDPAFGEWVARHPSITDKRGYHYSQLFSHFVDPAEILHQYRTTNNPTDFWNLKIGNPWIEAENRISVEEVLSLCQDYPVADSDPGPCYLGADQGKDIHVVIGKKDAVKAGRIVHLGVYKDWSDLDRLMKTFHVSRAVCDALPELRNAREWAERQNGKAFLSFYQEQQRGRYLWNEKDLTVTSNRTESLDASHNEILTGQIVLPRVSDVVRLFAKHLNSVAKKLEEDEETGSKRYVYVKLGPDHFRHALNYECMARQFGAASFFGDRDLT